MRTQVADEGVALDIGRGRIIREGTKVAILSYGSRLADSLAAAEKLGALGFSTTVADARFAKPIDDELVEQLASDHEVLISVEEGAIGGCGRITRRFTQIPPSLPPALCL